jgi:DNA-binding GntR family transcriptional regulator
MEAGPLRAPDVIASALRAVETNTLQERVYARLREALFEGRLPPGETMNIRTLATALGTSVMPVREALQRLVAEHVLTQQPNRAFRVASLTRGQHGELLEIRCLNEGHAARLAAASATPDFVARLRALNDEMAARIAAGDVPGAVSVNQKFHFAVYRQAGSPMLMGLIESFWLRAGPFLGSLHTVPGTAEIYEQSIPRHLALVEALERRDGRAAERALCEDLRTANAGYASLTFGETDAAAAVRRARRSQR